MSDSTAGAMDGVSVTRLDPPASSSLFLILFFYKIGENRMRIVEQDAHRNICTDMRHLPTNIVDLEREAF